VHGEPMRTCVCVSVCVPVSLCLSLYVCVCICVSLCACVCDRAMTVQTCDTHWLREHRRGRKDQWLLCCFRDSGCSGLLSLFLVTQDQAAEDKCQVRQAALVSGSTEGWKCHIAGLSLVSLRVHGHSLWTRC
jgi:hypothetical protein